jgi:hypothetical protein
MTLPYVSAFDPWEFVGRGPEHLTVSERADQAADGLPSLVLIEGEAGIGKTSFLRAAVSCLDAFTVCWAGCDAAEQDWSYGVVDQWLRQLAPQARQHMPRPQDGPMPGVPPVQVGADLLDLIESACAERPVVLVIDDIHLADTASLQTLGFLLRRFWTDRVLVLATARAAPPGENDPLDITEAVNRLTSAARHASTIRLQGLTPQDTARLACVHGAPPPPEAVERLWLHTGGHPSHLRSVLAHTSPLDLADPAQPLPVPHSVAVTVRAALCGLPADSRLLVDALAVLDTEAPLALVGQLAGLTDPAVALGPAIESGLVAWRPADPSSPIRLRRASQRGAIYAAMEPAQRRNLHAATVPLTDRESSWLHQVCAADRADAVLADRLEQEAAELTSAGRSTRAATLLWWAAGLSADGTDRERRLLESAVRYQYLLTYDVQGSAALRAAVDRCGPSALHDYVSARYRHAVGDFGTADVLYRSALDAARAMGDPLLADRVQLGLGQLRTWQLESREACQLLDEVLERAVLDTPSLVEARYFLACAAMEIVGPEEALELADLSSLPDRPGELESPLLLARGLLRGLAGQIHAGIDDMTTVLAPPDAAKGLDSACVALPLLLYLAGEWDAADSLVVRLLAAAGDVAMRAARCHAVAAVLAAGRGNWDAAAEHHRACGSIGGRAGADFDRLFLCLSAATAAQARADGAGMLAGLRPVRDSLHAGARPAWRILWLPLLAEAEVSAGHLDEARRVCTELSELAAQVPCLRAAAAWVTGQLAERGGDQEAALAAYRDGIAAQGDADDIPLHRARLEHAYGALLLARGDRTRAAGVLRLAHERYCSLGAAPFAARIGAAPSEQ